MRLTRRRFLALSAAAVGYPATAAPTVWQGRALGAEVSLTIRAPREEAEPAIAQAQELLAEIEQLFSLFDPSSTLSRLNNLGTLEPPERFFDLVTKADQAHQQSKGLFDPTVQPLWRALVENLDVRTAEAAIGWDRVGFDATEIRLDTGQALTFNGIAQGYATDLVSEALVARGLKNLLVNVGEFRCSGGPWTLGIVDPEHGRLGQRRLKDCAIATSSPTALLLGDEFHILHPSARPQWSTVSVEARTATQADSLSTAAALATRDEVEALRAIQGVERITLIDFDGNLSTV